MEELNLSMTLAYLRTKTLQIRTLEWGNRLLRKENKNSKKKSSVEDYSIVDSFLSQMEIIILLGSTNYQVCNASLDTSLGHCKNLF